MTTAGKCASCGGVGIEASHYEAADTVVKIAGYLPQAAPLFFLEDGSCLEVLYREWGRRDVYQADQVLFRFKDCLIIERGLADVSVIESSNEEALTIVVTLRCTGQLVLSDEAAHTREIIFVDEENRDDANTV